MPLISKTGRKHPKVIGLILSLYLLLTIGAVTMVYPFLLMISGSTKSTVDEKEFRIFPAFIFNPAKLYQKHVEGMFNERLDLMRATYDMDLHSFDKLELPPAALDAEIESWHAFTRSLDESRHLYTLGYLHAPLSRTQPLLLRHLKQKMIDAYGGSITRMNLDLETEFVNWNAFEVLPEFYLPRRNALLVNPWSRSVQAFKESEDPDWRTYFNVEGFYKHLFLKVLYARDIESYNERHQTAFASYDEIRLARRVPDGPPQVRKDWEDFVRNLLNLLWVRVDESAAPHYRAYLEAKYETLGVLNKNYGTDYAEFDTIPILDKPPHEGLVLSDWDSFIQGWKDPVTGRLHRPPVEELSIHSPEFMYRDFLQARHQDIGSLNRSWKTKYASFLQIQPPQMAAHYRHFLQNKSAIRKEFIVRNYIAVVDYMVLHGRGIFNTVVYCLLAVLAALIVNPMAAYALSRYKMPNTYKLLLFMLLTMAFPPMVTQIPVFLMLRDFDMLNTFAALVLPGMAHGYSIFLLKGFFDSLPRDLYESAQMDGANEWVMFWNITMSLSKPILAVIALGAFTAAYSNFMFALLICQDENMWTLMVWLFQLQQKSGQGVVYASLILAAIPTFFIFVFCQNIIMRGIVVPTEK